MKISLGLCGLPNSGKSTFIKLLTNLEVEIAPYPFTTLKAQEYAVPVLTPQLKLLHSFTKTKELIPPYLFFIDVPGLIKNAHQGEGLGNEFLSYLRGCQVIIEIVRNFYRSDVPHVEGRIDPIADIMTLENEIILADKEILQRFLAKLEKQHLKTNTDTEFELLKTIYNQLQPGRRFFEFEEKLKKFNLLVTKKWFLLINGQCPDSFDDERLNFFLNKHCLDFLWELDLLKEEELQTEFKPKIEEWLDDLRKDLNIIQFFTFTNEITQGWFTFKDTKIIEAVAQIHSDFAEKFKAVEVLSLDKFGEVRNWDEARHLGLVRNKSKDSQVEENEIIFVKI